MNFKEFFDKEEGWINSYDLDNRKTVHPSHEMQVIPVKKLGEWAYQVFLESANTILNQSEAGSLSFFFKDSESDWKECLHEASDYAGSLWEIEIDFFDQLEMAIVCLGEEKVIQKLYEMRSKRDYPASQQ